MRAGLRPKPDSLSTLSVLGHTLFIRARQPVTTINTTGHKCRATNDEHANYCLPYWGHTVLDYSAVLNTALKQCQHLTCQSVCAYSPPHSSPRSPDVATSTKKTAGKTYLTAERLYSVARKLLSPASFLVHSSRLPCGRSRKPPINCSNDAQRSHLQHGRDNFQRKFREIKKG